jgi:hypothetical protein
VCEQDLQFVQFKRALVSEPWFPRVENYARGGVAATVSAG